MRARARAARRFPPLRLLSPIVAQGTSWWLLHPDLRRVPRLRVVVDAPAAIYRGDGAGE